MKHIPVLLDEVIHSFEGKQITVFFEGTVGLGGHAKEILQRHPEIQKYIACDRDVNALNIAKETLKPWSDKVDFVHRPFADIKSILKEKKISSIDAYLIDIGVSSMQLDVGSRGFSFKTDAPLDMRMDESANITAADLVNTLPEIELARIFYEYGEEFRSRAAAKAICLARKKRKITTTFELCDVLEKVLRKGKIHFATKVFQALRIAVNDELGQLKNGLQGAIESSRSGAVLSVISFHSLEDRIVKWVFKEDPSLQVITKKPLEATREETKKNPRSRSAKLRVAEKI